jgi:hypothetical protein
MWDDYESKTPDSLYTQALKARVKQERKQVAQNARVTAEKPTVTIPLYNEKTLPAQIRSDLAETAYDLIEQEIASDEQNCIGMNVVNVLTKPYQGVSQDEIERVRSRAQDTPLHACDGHDFMRVYNSTTEYVAEPRVREKTLPELYKEEEQTPLLARGVLNGPFATRDKWMSYLNKNGLYKFLMTLFNILPDQNQENGARGFWKYMKFLRKNTNECIMCENGGISKYMIPAPLKEGLQMLKDVLDEFRDIEDVEGTDYEYRREFVSHFSHFAQWPHSMRLALYLTQPDTIPVEVVIITPASKLGCDIPDGFIIEERVQESKPMDVKLNKSALNCQAPGKGALSQPSKSCTSSQITNGHSSPAQLKDLVTSVPPAVDGQVVKRKRNRKSGKKLKASGETQSTTSSSHGPTEQQTTN